MESRATAFGTSKKRSTLMETKTIPYPREEDTAPRMLILAQECPDQLSTWKQCLTDNKGSESVCEPLKMA